MARTFTPQPSGLTKAPRKEHPAAPQQPPAAPAAGQPLRPMTVRIPADLARKAKLRAVEQGRPLQELVADALDTYLQ